MDPLSDVIRAVRLNGAYFYRVEAAAPWSVPTISARELMPRVLPDAEHLISYHILLAGSCWAGLDSDRQVQMEPGDVIVFPHGDPHLMSSPAQCGLRELGAVLASAHRYTETVFLGPEDARDTTLVCGFLGCDVRPFNPLLAALPRYMHAPGIGRATLLQFPAQVVTESRVGGAGNETMVIRMAELMFIEAVRQHVGRQTTEQTGWLAGLVDPVVGAALSQLHADPAKPWTLIDLARVSAVSRTVLAERFSHVIGVPPMLYLKRWRLQLASDRLARGSAKVATIATEVGYESEAAFSRAFKQETGISPAAWRRTRQQH
jgi:AraC-like DNA-binding protein